MPAKPYKTVRISTPWSIPCPSSLRAAASPCRPLPPAGLFAWHPSFGGGPWGSSGVPSAPAVRSPEQPVPAESGPLGRKPCLEDGLGLCSGCSPASPTCSPGRILAAPPSPMPSTSKWKSGSCRRQCGAVVPAAATPGPAGLWCWSPLLCFWPGQRTPVWYLQWGQMGVSCASASPHPAAVVAGEAFLQVPWRPSPAPGSSSIGVFAGCVCSCWAPGTPLSQSLKLNTVPGCGQRNKPFISCFSTEDPLSLGALANVGMGATSYFQIFSISRT